MVGFRSKALLYALDHDLSMRQRKKDDQFAPPIDFGVHEMSIEELRRKRDRQYLEENFPEEDFYFDNIVKVEDL